MQFHATLILFVIALSPHVAAPFLQNHPGQTQAASPIQFDVTVTDKSGALVDGLQAEHFEVFIEKKLFRVVSTVNIDVPVSVGIVFDSSASMKKGSAKATRQEFLMRREALRRFLELSHESNDYFLMAFNERPQLRIDWTSDRSKIVDSFNHLNVFGGSAFYDACYLAVEKLQRGRHAKRVLILVSDGLDNVSTYTYVELRELLKNSGVILYAVNFPDEFDSGSSLGMEAEGTLEELSSLTGGVALNWKDGRRLSLKDVLTVFERIANELRHQYTISIAPDELIKKPKWRKITVRVKPPTNAAKKLSQLNARTRAGFTAPVN